MGEWERCSHSPLGRRRRPRADVCGGARIDSASSDTTRSYCIFILSKRLPSCYNESVQVSCVPFTDCLVIFLLGHFSNVSASLVLARWKLSPVQARAHLVLRAVSVREHVAQAAGHLPQVPHLRPPRGPRPSPSTHTTTTTITCLK